MAGKIILRVVAALVLIAAVAVIAAFAYNVGATHTALQSGQAPAAAAGSAPYPYYGWVWPFFPFFGFGLFGLLIPFILICIVFGAIRRLIWGGPYWGHMHRRHWGGPMGENDEGLPPMFAEWHRRAHQEPTDDATKK